MIIQLLKSCLCMIIFFCIDIMGMDQQLAKADIGTMLAHETLVAEIITRDPFLLDHNTICSFAMTNKKYNRHMFDTAPERKKYLRKYETEPNAIKVFHRYGGAYAKGVMMDSWGKRKDLFLIHHYLIGSGRLFNDHKLFRNFISFLDTDQIPFCNEKGVLSLYGYAVVDIEAEKTPGMHTSECLTRYGFDGSQLRCFLRTKDENNELLHTRLIRNVILHSELSSFLMGSNVPLRHLPATTEKRYVDDMFIEECVMIDFGIDLIRRTPSPTLIDRVEQFRKAIVEEKKKREQANGK